MVGQNTTAMELSLDEIISDSATNFDVVEIIHLLIATIGIITNLTVVVVFLNNKKLRRKIPNRLIVNQVRIHLRFFLNDFH